MMQTRRFAVAEKHLQIALSLLKDSLMVERKVCIPGIALTIGLFDDLYSVQNQKAEKQDYLWNHLGVSFESRLLNVYSVKAERTMQSYPCIRPFYHISYRTSQSKLHRIAQ